MSRTQVVILAGGQGSRLRPFTTILPKPLVPVGDFPIMEIILRQLKFYGFKKIAIATGYLAELIESYFGDGSRWGVEIDYVRETQPLGTAGAVQLIKDLDDAFLVVNGDTLTNMNFRELMMYHQKKKCIATIAVKQRVVKTDFGVIQMDDAGRLTAYLEKPEHKSYVSTGINVFCRECQKFIEKDRVLGMPELMTRLKDSGETVSCFKFKGFWLDLGRLGDLQEAQDVWGKNKKKFLK